MFRIKCLLCFLLFSAAAAWELPAFLTEDVSSFPGGDFTPIDAEQPMEIIRELDVDATGETSPTEAPTESPAPSPSPSEIPTSTPTITGKPSPTPTEVPTESPAPSPSPSEIPTAKPSAVPSDTPSNAPSISMMPTETPSISPTEVPSDAPTASPSANPTISTAPSTTPSVSPTNMPSFSPSVAPSSSPTHVVTLTASLAVSLPLETGGALNETATMAFAKATEKFINEAVHVAVGRLDNAIVIVRDQKAVEITETRRKLIDSQQLELRQALEVQMVITADYMGSDMDFDLQDNLEIAFKVQAPEWYRYLVTEDKTFNALTSKAAEEKERSSTSAGSIEAQSNKTGAGNGLIVSVSLLTTAALALAIAASVYAIRRTRTMNYGNMLSSPSQGNGSNMVRNNEKNNDFRLNELAQDTGLTRTRSEESELTSEWGKPLPISPNTLEKGNTLGFDQLLPVQECSHEEQSPIRERNSWNHNMNRNNKDAKDPPTAASEAEVSESRSDPQAMGSLFDNTTEVSDLSKSRLSENGSIDQTYSDKNHEIMLTRSEGGTLGASATAGSNAESGFSGFSSHARSFFEGLSGAKVPTTETGGRPYDGGKDTLGARPHEPREKKQLQEDSSLGSNSMSLSRRAGLYDVFAPAGPIGIVVDTTKHGPAVHSLKRTSPMLGLINPGDLIVGLDDEDTRGMTAATLTRLMAKKANQKERKITLLTTEQY